MHQYQALSGDCGFMAANMYAKSIFGEDVLANLSIEKPLHLGKDASVQGHVRIRAKSQVGYFMLFTSKNRLPGCLACRQMLVMGEGTCSMRYLADFS